MRTTSWSWSITAQLKKNLRAFLSHLWAMPWLKGGIKGGWSTISHDPQPPAGFDRNSVHSALCCRFCALLLVSVFAVYSIQYESAADRGGRLSVGACRVGKLPYSNLGSSRIPAGVCGSCVPNLNR